MARKRTHDEFLYELKRKNVNVEIIGTYVNNTTKIKCRCPKHNKIYYTTPKILLLHENTNCCLECLSEFRGDNNRLPYETFLKRLKEKDIDVIPIEGYDGLGKKMTFKCSCGELWITTPSRVLLGNHCKKCGYGKMMGENNYFYNPNLTDEERYDATHRFRNPEYKTFIKECFERDNFTCRITGKKSTGDINVHHINGYNWDIKNRCNVCNGITLCVEIHKEFHKMYGKGDNTKEQFISFISYLKDNNRITDQRYFSILDQLKNIE